MFRGLSGDGVHGMKPPIESVRQGSGHMIRDQDCVVLDAAFLAQARLTPFQRRVAEITFRTVDALSPTCVTATASLGGRTGLSAGTLVLRFLPRREGAAAMTINIEPKTSVHIEVGEGTTYSLPDDVWDPRVKDITGFTEQIVRAVIAGKVRETIVYRGHVPVKWNSEIDIEGGPVSMRRSLLLGMLVGGFRRCRTRDVQYAPYGPVLAP